MSTNPLHFGEGEVLRAFAAGRGLCYSDFPYQFRPARLSTPISRRRVDHYQARPEARVPRRLPARLTVVADVGALSRIVVPHGGTRVVVRGVDRLTRHTVGDDPPVIRPAVSAPGVVHHGPLHHLVAGVDITGLGWAAAIVDVPNVSRRPRPRSGHRTSSSSAPLGYGDHPPRPKHADRRVVTTHESATRPTQLHLPQPVPDPRPFSREIPTQQRKSFVIIKYIV